MRTMLIFCVHSAIQSVKDGHNTLDVMFKQKMAWSFNALWEGDHPELDWNDNPMPQGSKRGPLADVFVACVWILIGDLEYYIFYFLFVMIYLILLFIFYFYFYTF